MDYSSKFAQAVRARDGVALAALLSITNPALATLGTSISESTLLQGIHAAFTSNSNNNSFNKTLSKNDKLWIEVVKAHRNVAVEVAGTQNLQAAFERQLELLSAVNRAADATTSSSNGNHGSINSSLINSFENDAAAAEAAGGWVVLAMSTVSKELRKLAILADNNTAAKRQESSSNKHVVIQYSEQDDGEENNLERASRAINRSFTICLNDRTYAKRRAVYFFFGELCKVYFHLHQKRNLIKYNLRVLATNVPAPTTTAAAANESDGRQANFPKAHIATYYFYSGVVAFIDREYTKARAGLEPCLQLCQSYPAATAARTLVNTNLQLIMLYIIPLRLLLLAPPAGAETEAKLPLVLPNRTRFPALHALYAPLLRALRAGDLHAYRAHAHGAARKVLVHRHLAAAIERLELFVVYALISRVHAELAKIGDPSRIDIGTLTRALSLSAASPLMRRRSQPLDPGTKPAETSLPDSSEQLEDEEEESIEDGDTIAYLVQLISMGFIKGYVSPDNGVVVFRKTRPFEIEL
jgi:hypothetical protein